MKDDNLYYRLNSIKEQVESLVNDFEIRDVYISIDDNININNIKGNNLNKKKNVEINVII